MQPDAFMALLDAALNGEAEAKSVGLSAPQTVVPYRNAQLFSGAKQYVRSTPVLPSSSEMVPLCF